MLKIIANKRNLILILAAVVIVLGLGVYGAFYYSSLRSKSAPNNNFISITNQEIKGNYIPPAISDIFSFPAKGVTSTISDLSNQRQQYISNFQTSDLSQTFSQLKAQLIKNGYSIYIENDKNYSLAASKNGELVQVMTPPNSSSSFIISVYK